MYVHTPQKDDCCRTTSFLPSSPSQSCDKPKDDDLLHTGWGLQYHFPETYAPTHPQTPMQTHIFSLGVVFGFSGSRQKQIIFLSLLFFFLSFSPFPGTEK